MTSPVIGTPWKKLNAPVSEEAIEGVDKYWRAANYLSIGQIYLRSNPLMKEPFTREDVKHRLVGHWGTTPGLNFLIGHINRLIADHQQNLSLIHISPAPEPGSHASSYADATGSGANYVYLVDAADDRGNVRELQLIFFGRESDGEGWLEIEARGGSGVRYRACDAAEAPAAARGALDR